MHAHEPHVFSDCNTAYQLGELDFNNRLQVKRFNGPYEMVAAQTAYF